MAAGSPAGGGRAGRPRVELRGATATDREAYVAGMRSSLDLYRGWMTPITTEEDFDELVRRAADAAFEPMVICRREDGAIVGFVNISEIVRGRFQSAFVGYGVVAAHARRGYMTEGLGLVLRRAFGELGLHRLEANIQPANAASIALVRRCGFELEGFSPRYLKIGGRWRDHERWAIRAEQWRAWSARGGPRGAGGGQLVVSGSAASGRRVVVVAPDSFKGTFTAGEVAGELAAGLGAGGIESVLVCPIADGGEGTLDALAGPLGAERRAARVHDPLGREIDAAFAITPDGATAIVELALAVGLGLVSPAERDPEAASTAGVGDLIIAARDAGAREVIVGLGGSATTDGGAGALETIVRAGGLGAARLVVLCDVRTPFELAAEVYAPQKGADPDCVRRLSRRLELLATSFSRDPRGRPMTGAAGGLSGGLWAELDARLVGGASFVLDRLGFDALLAGAAAVITGEGRLDAQTAAGKAVGELSARCARSGVPLHAVVGVDALGPRASCELGLTSVREAATRSALREAGGALAAGVLAGR
jgi:glycerate kinase